MMFKVRIFIETSYRGLKKSNGWYWSIVEYQTSKGPATVEYKNVVYGVTGNRLELIAFEKALEALKKPCKIELYTESNYIKRALEQHWIERWQQSEWKTATAEPVKNADVWEKIAGKIALHFVDMRFYENHEYKNAMKHELNKLKIPDKNEK